MTAASFGTISTGMGFINNDKFGASALELFSSAID
jgi:hypothetical protein